MKKSQYSMKIYMICSTSLATLIVLYLLGFIIVNGSSSFSMDFILSSPKGMPIGSSGGIYPALIGTIYFGLVAIIFSGILSLSMALYLCFYCNNSKIKSILRTIIGIIAGIPSIVLGLFGYGFFVVTLNLGLSILSGGLVLGIMIFPYIETNLEKVFLEVDKSLLSSSYALGVNKTYTLFKLVLPTVRKEILSTFSLGTSLALGASAPILLTGAVTFSKVPKSILSPAMALPVHLYYLMAEGISVENAYGTAFVMILLLFILNAIPFLTSKKS